MSISWWHNCREVELICVGKYWKFSLFTMLNLIYFLWVSECISVLLLPWPISRLHRDKAASCCYCQDILAFFFFFLPSTVVGIQWRDIFKICRNETKHVKVGSCLSQMWRKHEWPQLNFKFCLLILFSMLIILHHHHQFLLISVIILHHYSICLYFCDNLTLLL